MPCKDFLSLVEKLADGEVTTAEKREAEAHLNACEDCREHFRFLKALPHAVRQGSPAEPPAMYWEALPGKIMARIARTKEREKPASRGWFVGFVSPSRLRWAGALAAAAVAAAVGLQILEAPFSSHPPSADVARAPSVPSLSESRPGGKEGQAVVGGLSGPDGEPAGGSVSGESFSARQRERRDQGLAPQEPAAEPSAPQTPQLVQEIDGSVLRDELTADDGDEVLQKARAVGEVGTDEVASNAPEEVASESRRRIEASARRLEAGGEPSGEASQANPARQAAPAPVGARASESRPGQEAAGRRIPTPPAVAGGSSDDYLALLERYPLVGAEATDAGRDSTRANEASADGKVKECSDWRDFVERHGGEEEGTLARYRLALCSIALFDLRPSDDHQRQAMEDGQSYLAAQPSGERAHAIRRALERIRR